MKHIAREIRNCLAFHQYRASCALCRTLLELCVKDVCIRKEWIYYIGNYEDFYEEYKFCDIREKIPNKNLLRRVRNLYKELSRIIHNSENINYSNALLLYKNAREIIQRLYEL